MPQAEAKKNTAPVANADAVVEKLAELTGVEPATFAVTGRCSNQLRYNST